MDIKKITDQLVEISLIEDNDPTIRRLTGGVSSDIWMVAGGDKRFVIKRALKKLRVKDDWFADVSRNRIEQEFTDYVQSFLPDSVPDILYRDHENGFFVMEYLHSGFKNWKKQLMDGRFNAQTAQKAAGIMSTIHLHSKDDQKAKSLFNTTSNFYSLRIEPYLMTTGKRHPELRQLFEDEATRLEQHREALVHGDFSPKNIMVHPERLVLLDQEVAWYGDPAFDVAFLLNHLYLKMLHNSGSPGKKTDLSQVVWKSYFKSGGNKQTTEFETRIGRLLLMLMLARVDGKSPVEYLKKEEKEFVRSFVYKLLPAGIFAQQEINSKWKSKLKEFSFEH